MYATLISMFLPKVDPATVTEGSAPAQKKPSQSKSIPVWDMDKKDWRSINLDTITEWEQLVTPDPVI